LRQFPGGVERKDKRTLDFKPSFAEKT